MVEVILRSVESIERIADVIAVAVVVLLAYLGVALAGVLLTSDKDRAKLCYKVFADLLTLFRRRQR